jgi:hypothetical protein
MAGINEQDQIKIFNAKRLQLTPDQLIILWRRNKISDDELQTLLAQVGMISVDDQVRLDQATQFVPPVTDLLHFMVRAVGNAEVVERFGLMDEYDDLFAGSIPDWAKANGISDEVMHYYHASHWVVPPSGQLFEMYRRLRDDNIPPGIAGDDWVVTDEDINRALRENGVAPYWRERLKAIGFNPLPMRQATHAFVVGAATDDEVKEVLRDNGYSLFGAGQFLTWLGVQRRDHIRTNAIVRMYIGMGINRADALQRLQEEGYDEAEVNDVLDWASQQADDKSKEKCLSGLEKQFAQGAFDETEAQGRLSELGLDADQVVRLIDQWNCQKKAAGKQIAASQLCAMADHGLVTPDEYLNRLENLGYDHDDAMRIVAECNIKLSERQLRAREQALSKVAREQSILASRKDSQDRRIAADLRRQANLLRTFQREQATAEARAKRELQREIDKAARQTTQAQKMRQAAGGKARSIEMRLAKASQVWAEVAGKELSVAASDIQEGINAAKETGNAGTDIAVRAAVMAALAAKKRGTVDLPSEIVELAQLLLAYGEVANASVCGPNELACSTPESNAGNVDQGSTTPELLKPRSNGNGSASSGTFGT